MNNGGTMVQAQRYCYARAEKSSVFVYLKSKILCFVYPFGMHGLCVCVCNEGTEATVKHKC